MIKQEYIKEHRGYQIKPHKDHPKSLVIVTTGKGGKIPAVMEELFTTAALARQVIDSYVERKEEVDDKAVKKGRS